MENVSSFVQSDTTKDIMLLVDHSANANTAKTYKGYQKEFLEWCQSNPNFRPSSRCTVTEEKLIQFLHTQVTTLSSKLSI